METLRQENRKTETVMAAGVFLVMLRKMSLSLISGVTSGSRIHRFLAAFPNRQCQTCESYFPSLTSWVTDTTLYDVCSCAVWLLCVILASRVLLLLLTVSLWDYLYNAHWACTLS